jgi:hypothetical protein
VVPDAPRPSDEGSDTEHGGPYSASRLRAAP